MRFLGPGAPFQARVVVPGDKSMSHRALIFAAMAQGRSLIRGQGPGADVESTREALRAFGVTVEGDHVSSEGIESWTAPAHTLEAGNSATTMRLLAGAVAGRPFTTTITGDDSLMRRPMRRVADPLRALGAGVEISSDGTPPLVITGGPLRGTSVEIPIPSAQVRTAVALAAIQGTGTTSIASPPGFRDHTERWLRAWGMGSGDAVFDIHPGPIPPMEIELPGDPSSAAFLWVAAALTPGSTVSTERVSLNPGRLGLLHQLRAMGAEVAMTRTGDVLGDPVGDVVVTGAALNGVTVGGVDTVKTLDELPVMAIAAAFSDGPTVVSDAAELRAKETDRIATTVAMVIALGGQARETPGGFEIDPVPLTGGSVDAGGDHRIAMAAAVAATRGVAVEVEGFSAAAVSWPGFDKVLEAMWSSR